MTVYLDARSSMGNRALSYFILQTRKRNVCLYYTTQRIAMIDRRLREHTMVLVECKDTGKPNHRFIIVHDFRKGNVAPTCFSFAIQNYFKYYDTNEVVSPVVKKRLLPETKQKFSSQSPEVQGQ